MFTLKKAAVLAVAATFAGSYTIGAVSNAPVCLILAATHALP